MTGIGDWASELLIADLLAVLLVTIVFGLALRNARRDLHRAEERMRELVDPCEDPIEIRLRCLDHQIRGIAAHGRHRHREIPSRR